MHPLVKYCQFGESLVNHSDSDANFCGASFSFMSWCLILLCCWRFMYVFIFLVKLTDWPPIGKIDAHSAYEMSSWYKYLIVSLVFSHFGFLAWNSFSDCAFS